MSRYYQTFARIGAGLAAIAMLVWFLWPGGAWQFEPEPFFAFGVAVVVWAFTEFKLSEEVIYRASTPNDIRFGREIFSYGTWNLRLKLQVQHPRPAGHRMLRWTNDTSTSTARNVA